MDRLNSVEETLGNPILCPAPPAKMQQNIGLLPGAIDQCHIWAKPIRGRLLFLFMGQGLAQVVRG